MNLQLDRIQQACESLKLNAIASEWSALADQATSQEQALAEFLEKLLRVELEARQQRTRDTLLKFAGLPVVKRFEDYDFKFATGAPRRQLQEPTLSICCFRFTEPSIHDLNAFNQQLVRRMTFDNQAMPSTTRIGDRFAIRPCFIGARHEPVHVDRLLAEVVRVGRSLLEKTQ